MITALVLFIIMIAILSRLMKNERATYGLILISIVCFALGVAIKDLTSEPVEVVTTVSEGTDSTDSNDVNIIDIKDSLISYPTTVNVVMSFIKAKDMDHTVGKYEEVVKGCINEPP